MTWKTSWTLPRGGKRVIHLGRSSDLPGSFAHKERTRERVTGKQANVSARFGECLACKERARRPRCGPGRLDVTARHRIFAGLASSPPGHRKTSTPFSREMGMPHPFMSGVSRISLLEALNFPPRPPGGDMQDTFWLRSVLI